MSLQRDTENFKQKVVFPCKSEFYLYLTEIIISTDEGKYLNSGHADAAESAIRHRHPEAREQLDGWQEFPLHKPSEKREMPSDIEGHNVQRRQVGISSLGRMNILECQTDIGKGIE